MTSKKYCSKHIPEKRYPISLCSCFTPQNVICGGTIPQIFLLASLAANCTPTLKIVAPPLAVRPIYH